MKGELKKRLGQHFLHSESVLDFEAELAVVGGMRVLEIGGGDGRLTEKLLERGPKELIVVEKDPHWAEELRRKFGKTVKVVEGDFLEEEFGGVDVIVGNIPYYISSPILFKIAKMEFKRAILLVQLEFAKRMVAKPRTSEYGRLSVTTQLLFRPTYVKKVKRGSFVPPPKVDSAIVLLRKTEGAALNEWVGKVIRVLFQHKNQYISNALKHGRIEFEGELPKKRAREMGPGEIVELAERLRPSRA